MEARRQGRGLVRALNLTTGEERLLDAAGDASALGQAAARAARDNASRRFLLEDGDWFLTVYHAPREIVVVGAVHIAQALAALALAAGYRVRVIDPRAPYATEERFPGIALQRAWPDEALREQPLTPRSALVVLAHDVKLDDDALAVGLSSPAFYIGALGSARTHARRLARLSAQGFSQAQLARIHGPVGLAIGARAPGEIAIAILAELIRLRHSAQPPKIAGIVLAAGTSSRMGRNKLVETVHGKPLLRNAADAAIASRLDPVLVVTGHQAGQSTAALAGAPVTLIHNRRYAEGLSSSLRAGLAAVPEDCDGAMILLADMPDITPELIDRLIAAFDPRAGRAICVATAGQRRGHPVLWARRYFPELMTLTGDKGGREILQTHAAQVVEIESDDNAPLADIDTVEALAAYRN